MKFYLYSIGWWAIITRSETVSEEDATLEFGTDIINKAKADKTYRFYHKGNGNIHIFTDIAVA